MSVTIVLGTQWGDEGKGRAVDRLAGGSDLVARFNGGNNAGHTVVNSLGTFKIHLVPSGVFHARTRCLLGGGMVMDPEVLIAEMDMLREAGVRLEKRLFISKRAHLIMPYHKIIDGLYEEAKGAGATGTTRRGIGPAFADKVSYNGLRWSDLENAKLFKDKLETQLTLKNKIIVALGGERLDANVVCASYLAHYELVKSYLCELTPIVQKGLRDGKRFLLEQAMGTFLDPDWGTYPFVTASTTLASAATSGLGIPPRAITRIIGVTKAYTTRVGAGPLPTELADEADAETGRVLAEVAATTGRTRRAGWLDLELVRFAARLNGIDELFLTKLDVLSELDVIKVNTGYQLDGKRVTYADLDAYRLAQVKPIYRSLPGWRKDIRDVRKYSDLPARARNYVETIERSVGVPVRWISVGPERDAVIRRRWSD
jgi:adenylosuccinate synthase